MAQRLKIAQLILILEKCSANTPERALVLNEEMTKIASPVNIKEEGC
jgi:hypothetical protein